MLRAHTRLARHPGAPSTLGERLLRRLLPAALLIPFALGGLGLWAQNAGLYGAQATAALVAGLTAVLFAALVITAARALRGLDDTRLRIQQELQAMLDATTAVVYLKSADGRYLFVNRRFGDILHRSPEEIRGKTAADLFSKELADSFGDNDRRVFATGQPLEVEEQAPHDDGPHSYISLKVPVFDGAGRVYALCGISTDITERNRAEERLRLMTAQLERSNKSLEEFAAVASHDLQEPLRKILVFGGFLKDECTGTLSAEGHGHLERVLSAATRMQTLINDLLTYARVTTRTRPFARVELDALVREVLADLEARVRETGAQVDLGPLPRLDADPVQMRQLFQNLLSNALKFRRSGVAPQIAVAGRALASGAPNGCYEFTVQDNGIGFDEKYRHRLFTPFQRLVNRGDYPGTGIGLAVCRKIVERHGGHISVRSRPGEGSTFTFTLPATQAQEHAS